MDSIHWRVFYRFLWYDTGMKQWDYHIAQDAWMPRTETEWLWYLERKINYDDWRGLKKEWILGRWENLQKRLDPGKRVMLGEYLGKNYD